MSSIAVSHIATAAPRRERRVESSTARIAPPRVAGIDAARIFAATGTIWVHALGATSVMAGLAEDAVTADTLGTLTRLGRFAVPFFAFIAGWFLVASQRRSVLPPAGQYIANRSLRLYGPFLVWSILTLAARYLNSVIAGTPPPTVTAAIFLSGGAHHLWFLSFVTIATAVSLPIVRWVVGHRGRELALAAVLVGACVVVSATYTQPLQSGNLMSFDYFFERVWARSPALLAGLAAGLYFRTSLATLPRRDWVAMLLIAAAVACVVLATFVMPTPILQNLAGILIALAGATALNVPGMRRIGSWGPWAYGVFLSHSLLLQLSLTVLIKAGVEPGWGMALQLFGMTVFLSVGLTFLLRRHRFTRWLVP